MKDSQRIYNFLTERMEKAHTIIGSGKILLLTSFLLQLSWSGIAINPGIAGAGCKVNHPPSFERCPLETCVFQIGRPVEFALPAVDPDGDSITFRTNHFPEGAFFNPERQVLSWTPKKGQEGYYLGFEVDAADQAGNSNKIVFNAIVIPESANKTDGSRVSSIGEADPGAAVSPEGQEPGSTSPETGGESEGGELEEEKTTRTPKPAAEETEKTIGTPSPAPTPEKTPSPSGGGSDGDTVHPTPVLIPETTPIPVLTPETTPTPVLTPEATPTPKTKRDIFVTTAEDEDDPETDPDNPLGTGLSLREAIEITLPGWTIRFDLPLGDSRIVLSDKLIIDKDEVTIDGERKVTIDAGEIDTSTVFKITGSKNVIRRLKITNCYNVSIMLVEKASNNLIEENDFFNFETGILLDGDDIRDNIIRNNDINVGDNVDILIIHSGSGSFSLSDKNLLPEEAGVKFMGTTQGLYLDDSPFAVDENPDPGFCFAGHAEYGTRISAAVLPSSQSYSFDQGVDPETFIPNQTFTVTTSEDNPLDGNINYGSLSLRQILFYLSDDYNKITFDKTSLSSASIELERPLDITDSHLYITGGSGESVAIVPGPGAFYGSGPAVLIHTAGNMLENLKFEGMPGPAVFLANGAKDNLLGFGTALTPWIIDGTIYTSIIDANNNQIYKNNYASFSVIFKNYNLGVYMRFY